MNSSHAFARTYTCALFLAISAFVPAFGLNPSPSQVYYVPVPESDQLAAYTAINAAAVDPLNIFVTFSAASDNTVIYYDHWEDGYEEDITNPKQSTTQVYGDGNTANGYPPGNAGDLISAGTVFSLRNYVTSTQGSSVIKFDARDKIASFKPISLTKTSFPASTNSLLAGCVEVFERGLWGTEYRVPVGVDMPTSTAGTTLTYDTDIFSYTAISIMAGAGGANVQIDANNDGIFEQTVALAEGGTQSVAGVSAGARVLADKPVQVVMFTGRPTSNYQSRDTSLLPTYRWSSSYYAPVSTPATYGTVVFLYNPGTSAITVNYDYRSSASAYTTANVSVPAGGNARVTLSPASGTTHYGAYRFYTTGGTPPVFYAFCAVDAASASTGDNQSFDGGFTLVGQPSLTTQVLLSLGIGRDPNSTTNPTENGNPVWITTAGNGHTAETVYVDYNGDNAGVGTDANGNHYDVSFSLRELEQKIIYDPDGDQSGMLVYVLNPAVKIAAAWAQDPSVASASQPGLDVSTLIPPLREGDGSKGSTIAVDSDGDGYKSAGDTLEYDIRTINTARTAIVGPYTVKDNLPADVTYVTGTAKYRYSVNNAWQAWVAIPDDGSGTVFPLDGSGYGIPGTLGVGQQIQVVFRAAIKPYGSLVSPSAIVNTGSILVTPYGVTLDIGSSDPLYGSIGDRLWIDANGNGVQDGGEAGLNNARLYLDGNNNGMRDSSEATTLTAGDGNYVFNGLLAGTYVVRVDSATVGAINPGYGATYDLDGIVTSYVATVSLSAALDRTDVDFGFRVGASVGDRVWIDRDADGVQEAGEPGINGVRVYEDANNNNAYDSGEPNTITSGDGNYYIGNLTAGTHAVRVDTATLPVGATQTFDLNGGLDHEGTVTLISAEHRADLDFGYRGTLSIGDLVWNDINADGGTAGPVTTYLINNGRIDVNGDGSANDSDDGFIGTMRIINGYVDIDNDNSTPVDNSDDGTFLGKTIVNGGFDLNADGSISTSGSNDDGSASYTGAAEAGIANVRVYIDFDGDGVFDSTEPSAITNASGAYTLGNLFNGTYTVRVDTGTLPSSYVETYDLTNPKTDHTATVVLSGSSRTDVDFGYRNDGSIGDRVWNDRDADGVVDAAEPGIEGVIVYIDANSNGIFDQATEEYDITDVNGYYLIDNLPAGTYSVRVDISTLPQGSTQTFDYDGTGTASRASRTLTVSQDAADVDFGYRATASVGDFVWNDANANGVQDSGETGISGARVYLDINGNGTYDNATEPAATTNASGAYLIDFLVPGTYTARIDTSTLAATLVQTHDFSGDLDHAATFSLSAAQARTDIDFGYTTRVMIGDFVWNDANANGQQDSGETGISGVMVTAFNAANDTITATTTTNSSGAYSFTLMPGSYYVVFDKPAGYNSTLADNGADATDSDANATTGKTGNVTLTGGQSNLTLDAGFYQPVAIGDFVWNDVNANGQQDSGETGVNGVTVTLYRPGFGSDGIAGTADDATAVATTVTAGGGAYAFTSLRPGIYNLNFGTLAGSARTLVDQGADASDSDANAGTGTTTNYTLAAGATNNTIDAGYYQPGAVGDFVWSDANANGQQDSGEAGLNGVAVTLYSPGYGPDGIAGNSDDATLVATTTTGGGGVYSFGSLRPGTYQLTFGTLSGYSRTLADLGADATDSDANAGTGQTATFTVSPGVTNGTIDAGFYQAATIGDFVWNDVNANGQQDSGETGLAGVTVSLYRPGFGADGIASTADDALAITSSVTNSTGAYSFSGLRPGTYQVGFSALSGYGRSIADNGVDTTDSDANAGTGLTATFAVAAGATNNTVDAAYFQTVSIGDFVFNDSNANGQQDSGEVGLAGVLVSVYRPGFGPDGVASTADDAMAVATFTTLSGGAYNFTGLPPGTYQVGFSALPGYNRTIADNGGDATDSDANAGTGLTATFVMGAGATNNTIDAGYHQPVAIGDLVFNDANANGQQDSGEAGLAGVSVSLYRPGFGADGIAGNADDALAVSTFTTSAGGAYSFTGLRPGTYQVNFGTLSGYNRTLADNGADATDSDANSGTGQTANIVMAAGATNNTVDAGYHQPVSIGDLVFNDANANGQQDSGEAGLAGVLVSVYRPGFGPDGVASTVDDATAVATFTTLSGGAYNFKGLPPGTYQVGFGALSGYNRTIADNGADTSDSDANASTGTTPNIILTAGQNIATIDAGYFQPAAIGDLVWNDTNANGQKDGGENGLNGVTVTLYRPGFGPDGIASNGDDATAVATTTTGGGGGYHFTGLRPGTYQMNFGTLSGYSRTLADQGVDSTDSDANAGTGTTASIVLIAGQTNDTIDAGYYQPAAIGDIVWDDPDVDGLQESGETGLAGVPVSLYRPGYGADGIPGNGDDDQPVTSTTTPGTGSYSFTGLRPGTYQMRFGSASGYNRTIAGQGLATGDSDPDPGTGVVEEIVLAPGQTDNSIDAGYYQPCSISGSVLADTDGDNDGDVPLAGVVIRLLNGAGTPVLDGSGAPVTTTTLADGSYSFGGLTPGSYQVREDQPSGYNSVSDIDGANNNLIGNEHATVVTAGGNNAGNDFIEIQMGNISGHVLADTDGNNSGDSPISGVTLHLLNSSGTPVLDGLGAPVVATTNGSGYYLFTGVPMGSYRVSESQPAGYGSVSDVDGANYNVIGDQTPIVLVPGQAVTGRDFVEVELGSIAGAVRKDEDNDGLPDVGMQGVTMTLLDGTGNPADGDPGTPGVQLVTAVTDPDGLYIFVGLFPGSYQVSESQPSGYGSVTDVDGGNPDRIGNVTVISVAPGQEVTGRDFLEIQFGSISGYVRAGLAPLANVTLTLLDEDGDPVDGDPNTPGVQPITTVTDSNGHYTFTGVIPGDYRVGQTQPFGYNSFGDRDGGDINVIGDLTRISVLPGEENAENNFVETLDTCPDTWAEWLFQHPAQTATGNPDADRHDNLAEFAFAMKAESGAGDAWHIQPSTLAPGTIEGVFVRPKGALQNVVYTLQHAAVLANPVSWSPIEIEIESSMITVVDNGDCTETVTIHDLETLTGHNGGEGFVRIRADLDADGNETIEHTTYTETEGWWETGLELCCRTYNNPFLRSTVFTGTVGGVSGQTLDLAGSAGPVDLATLIGGGSYYLEVTSGDNEGQRFDVVSATGSSVTLANDSDLFENEAPYNTVKDAPAASLAGDRIVLRRHWTLGELFPAASFTGTDDFSTADQVQLFAKNQWVIYWLYDDGVLAPRWVKQGGGYSDQSAAVLAPGQGMFFNNRHTVQSILAYGEVRTNRFVRPLITGSNLISGGYPLDQSPANTANGWTMTAANGFNGTRDLATADTFNVWKSDTVTTATGYDTYFLNNNAPRVPNVIKWVKTGDATLVSHNNDPLLLGNRSVFLKSKNGLAGYATPVPWAP